MQLQPSTQEVKGPAAATATAPDTQAILPLQHFLQLQRQQESLVQLWSKLQQHEKLRVQQHQQEGGSPQQQQEDRHEQQQKGCSEPPQDKLPDHQQYERMPHGIRTAAASKGKGNSMVALL